MTHTDPETPEDPTPADSGQDLEAENDQLWRENDRLWRERAAFESEIRSVRAEIEQIHGSRLWKAASAYWALRRGVGRMFRNSQTVPDASAAPEPPAAPTAPGPSPSAPVAAFAHLRVAEQFRAFRTADNRRFFNALCRHLARLENDPRLSTYFEFAVTSNTRGERVADLLARHRPIAGKTFLDVGCACGGFLVAFARRGAQVVGCDVDDKLLRLAQENLKDCAIDAPLLRRDATWPEELGDLQGMFDLITANDVIEHVVEPAALLKSVAGLLRPGGLAYFEIPNPHAVAFVREDGHFGLFGITLLAHADAERYFALHSPPGPSGVGEYLELPEYERLFAEASLRFVLLEDEVPARIDAIEKELRLLRGSLGQLEGTVPLPLRDLVREKVARYLEELDRTPRRTAAERGAFVRRYGAGFWRVLGEKIGTGGPPDPA